MDEMKKTFHLIKSRFYQDFFANFQGDTSETLCLGCDGLCETSRGFSTTVFLLPGELTFLQEAGIHPEHLLDPIITAHGLIYCWSPAATCAYLQQNRCLLGKAPGIKPVECAIYPLIFKRNKEEEFGICPICQHRTAFINDGFISRAKKAVATYLLPHLDEVWLRYRNDLNFTINEDCYHQLKKEKAGRPMTIAEFKTCATSIQP
jgi:hypothetical protein